YLTLVLLFRSFVQPVTILVALPLSVGGALGLLLLTGKALGVTPLIGLLMLMGIAAKNSILLVEYALVAEKERGLGRFEALLDAARKRARPIVMTSIAMGAGMLPIARADGDRGDRRAPLLDRAQPRLRARRLHLHGRHPGLPRPPFEQAAGRGARSRQAYRLARKLTGNA
ncbi:efflux RND transporter permease subunit, partial [Mesorhizobium sp.]|uniref:efflux RND transporter permease subunit n=1 Tax=Mesorhizobium sp. TaxID=1871066 RepID=UPI00345B0315